TSPPTGMPGTSSTRTGSPRRTASSGSPASTGSTRPRLGSLTRLASGRPTPPASRGASRPARGWTWTGCAAPASITSETSPSRRACGRRPEGGGLLGGDAAGVYEVAKRGGNDILRPRHPGTPLRTGFHGTPAYAPDPRWVIQGHYRPFDEPQDVTVGSVVEGLQ